MKMRKFHLLKFTLVIVVLILLPLTTVGGQSSSFATYYVDGSFGSDSNSGSNSAPWRSVQHAIDTINSGDTVIVRGGIYRVEQLRFGPAGQGFQHRTVFRAAPGERVLFTRADGLPPQINMDNYVRVEGFWIGGAWNRETGGLFHVGSSPIGVGKQIVNNTIFGYRTGINIGSSEHLLVQGNRLVHTGNGEYEHGIYITGGGSNDGQRTNHIIVDRNVWVAGEGYGIHGWHHPKTTIITRNFVGRHNAGIVMGNNQSYEHLIANNIVWKNKWTHYPGYQLEGDNVYFVNNVHGPDARLSHSGQPGLTISHNVFIGPNPAGTLSIELGSNQLASALGATEAQIDAAIAALDLAFSQPIEVIYADPGIEAHFALLESLSAVDGGPLDDQGVRWFGGAGSFDIGVNVPAPTSQDAFWQAFRELGLREYNSSWQLISDPGPTDPNPTDPTDPTDPGDPGNPGDPDQPLPEPSTGQVSGLTGAPVMPQFTWTDNNASHSTGEVWYHLLVRYGGNIIIDKWYPRAQVCAGVQCYVASDQELYYQGAYTWKIETWKQQEGIGTLLQSTFGVGLSAPSNPQNLVIDTQQGRPQIRWQNNPGTAWFRVRIQSTSGHQMHNHWYRNDSGVCNNSNCELVPDTYLNNGNYTLYLAGWNPAGMTSEQSISFQINVPVPGLAQPLTTTHQNSGRPTFHWQGTPGATWYEIWIGTTDFQTKHMQWYSALNMGCANAGTCTLIADAVLENHQNFIWYVRSWGPSGLSTGGEGGWIRGDNISVNASLPSIPTSAMTPTSGVQGTRPTFSWQHSEDVSWYHFEISRGSTVVYENWYPVEALNCRSGNVCQLRLDNVSLVGEYTWRLQPYSPAGLGSRSSNLAFTINASGL